MAIINKFASETYVNEKISGLNINEAVNDALLQAKESGEFKGESGVYVGSGEMPEGYNVQIDPNGDADIEVLTAEETKSLIVEEVAKLGQLKPEFANSIEECTDTSKLYVLPDGMIYAYMLMDKEVTSYTNVLDNTEITINKRWSYSSKKHTDAPGHIVTGYIPVKFGDVIRVNVVSPYNWNADYNRVQYFNDGKSYATGHRDGPLGTTLKLTKEEDTTSWVVGYENTISDDDSTNTKITGADSVAFMMWIFNLGELNNANGIAITEADYKNAGIVMTINEEIPQDGGTTIVKEWGWANTGHAFVPADYEDRIIVLEDEVEKIPALEKAILSGGIDNTLADAYNRIKNWKYPIYEDSPVFLLETDKPAVDDSKWTTEAIYAQYDALMNANAHYISKVDCGKASDGTTSICVYKFKEPTPHYPSPIWSETKPTILICSGVHPTEQAGVWSLYYAMEEITNNPKLLDLRRNVDFIVMPMINPTAFTDSTYGVRNPDGIQVHYNFEVDFKYPTDVGYVAHGNRNHGGEAPLSIPETQYFNALMEEYKDTLALVMSCHNNDVDTHRGTDFIWCSCATHYMCNLSYRFADKMSVAWREKHGTAFDEGLVWANNYALTKASEGSSLFSADYVQERPSWDYRVGMASISSSNGTEYKQALKYGVHGINVEVCDRCMILDKDFNKKRTANVMTMGAETYINFFRTFMTSYDPKAKKEYAPNLPWNE